MFNKVETSLNKVNVVDLEHEILGFWKQHACFDKLREKNAEGPRWSFLDGPITANNPMGVHHAWGRTLKDVYQRYHAMLGHKLRYQNGFDCQGLWVEVEVEKELGFKCKTDIEAFGIEKFVEKCKERVKKYSAIQTEQSIRLGYWMDWENSYFTMTDENNYTIWSFLKKCHERGFIYKGHDVMPWCPRCGVGMSQHEMHEGYKEVKHVSVIVRFPLRERKGESLLVWTTTPWTLTSNVAAAVHPDMEYIRVRQGEHVLYLAKALEEKVLSGRGDWTVLEVLKGTELVGLTYDGPFDELAAQEQARLQHRIIAWDEVTESEGTGLVHIAPGCGAEDHQLGMQEKLTAVCPIDDQGVFMEGFEPFTGTHAYDVAPAILKSLDEKGIFYSKEKYSHNYPHCWRCSSQLLFRLVDEWFIAMDAWRHEIMDVARQIKWIPSYGLDLELDWLRNMRDWMISKKRYWGLALPIWECPECGWFDVIGGKEELKERAVAGWEEFEGKSPHKPQVDGIVVECARCGAQAHRIKDVGNPWLDAGIVPYSTMGYNSDREHWKKWFPAELVLECFPGQFRNWFYALLAMSTMMENRPPFKTLLGHALVRDEKGEEMHKSQGNAIWFDDAVEKIGADIMRWIYCSQDPTVNLNFGYGAAREVRGKFYNTFWQSYAYFCNYARLADYVPPKDPVPFEKRCDMDRWILSHLSRLIEQAPAAFEKYEIQRLVRGVEQFVDNLSNWYIRENRRRFWKNKEDEDARTAFDTLYRCIEGLMLLVAPIMPYTAEKMYQNLVRSIDDQAPVSVHLLDFPKPRQGWYDEQLLKDMDAARRLTSLSLSAREQAGVKVRQPLSELIIQPADETERSGALRFSVLLAETLNVKKVTVLPEGESLPVTKTVKPNFKKLGPRLGKKMKALASAIEQADAEDIARRLDEDGHVCFNIDGESVTIDYSEVKITEKGPDNLSVASDHRTLVAVKTEIGPELAREGLMRDTLRALQNLRKEVGLQVEDRIRLEWHSDSALLAEMIEEWKEHIKEELLCTEWLDAETAPAGMKELKIGNEKALVALSRTGVPDENH